MKLPVVHIKYSDDQPRDPAGSSTGGQFASEGGSRFSVEVVGKPTARTERKKPLNMTLINAEALRLGAGIDAPITLTWENRKGSLSIMEMEMDRHPLGEFTQRRILIYLSHIPSTEVALRTLRHEVAHAQFKTASQTSAVKTFIKNNVEALRKEGGTTPYAKFFWKDLARFEKTPLRVFQYLKIDPVKDKEASVRYLTRLAVDESRSEMAAEGKKMPPTYAALESLVRQHSGGKKSGDGVALPPGIGSSDSGWGEKVFGDSTTEIYAAGVFVIYVDEEGVPCPKEEAEAMRIADPDSATVWALSLL